MSFTESLNLEQIEQENEGKNAPFKDFILRFWPTGFIGFGGPQARMSSSFPIILQSRKINIFYE